MAFFNDENENILKLATSKDLVMILMEFLNEMKTSPRNIFQLEFLKSASIDPESMIYYILTKMMTLKESHFSLGLICHNGAITFFEVAFKTSTIFSHFTCSQRSREFKSYTVKLQFWNKASLAKFEQ